MSQALTLRWVTRSHKTGTQLPGRAGDGSGKVYESVGCIILELQVPPLLTKARPRSIFCVPSTAVMSIHALWLTEALPGFPAPWELLHPGKLLVSPRSSLWGFLGAICQSEHPSTTGHPSGAPCALGEPALDFLLGS